MIDTTIELIRDEFVEYLRVNGYAHPETMVVIENIALLDSNNTTNLDNSIVFTIVNIEEESTLKNTPALKKDASGKARYENPPTYLNIYLLISCVSKSITGDSEYIDTLARLSHVIRFFQGKNSFTAYDPTKLSSQFDDITDFKIKPELYTLTFEQINHLWGVLGGKQMPSVMYKLRLVAISGRKRLRDVPLIEEVNANLSNSTKNRG
ncbi:MAG TPA: DUF4255 domain-containing protein [Puia sp.]